MARPTSVDAYIRVSRVGNRKDDSFLSPDLQRESIERVCALEGLTVVKWFEELDASGGDNTRPLWNEAIERVEQGKTKGIVCWNLSRFSRSVRDALTAIERVENAGGRLYSEEGQLGRLDRVIRLAIAEDERDRARAGFRSAAVNAINRGIYIAAKIPFGYERDPETRRLLPDPHTAPIVRELFERRARNQSWAQLCRWLKDEHGITATRETLRTRVNNPAYLGHAYQGDIVNETAHDPIVSRLLWDKAHRARGSKPIHTGASASLLLRGIVACDTCGHKMLVGGSQGKMVNGRREKIHAYYCRNLACSDHAYAKAEDADAHVVERVLEFLGFANARLETRSSDAQELAQAEHEYDEAQYALDTFKANRRAITTLGVDAWNELLEDYVMARNAAQMQLEALKESSTDSSWAMVPDLWDEWTVESKREFLQKILGECSILPAHRRNTPIGDRINMLLNPLGINMRAEIRFSQIPEGWELVMNDGVVLYPLDDEEDEEDMWPEKS